MNKSFSFRRFEFFDVETCCDNLVEALSGSKPSCAVADGGLLVFGGFDGNILLVDRHRFEPDQKNKGSDDVAEGDSSRPALATQGSVDVNNDMNSSSKTEELNNGQVQKYKAFRGKVKAVAYLADNDNYNIRQQYIMAIGDDAQRTDKDDKTESVFVIKFFSIYDLERPTQVINISSHFKRLQNPGSSSVNMSSDIHKNLDLTAFAVVNDGSQVAIGFNTGSILLLTGLFLKDSHLINGPLANTNKSQQSIILLHKYHKHPVTSLFFSELPTMTTQT